MTNSTTICAVNLYKKSVNTELLERKLANKKRRICKDLATLTILCCYKRLPNYSITKAILKRELGQTTKIKLTVEKHARYLKRMCRLCEGNVRIYNSFWERLSLAFMNPLNMQPYIPPWMSGTFMECSS